MSETNAQEPTMEEILASIRRIISEDDAPQAEAPPAPAAVAAAPAPAPPVSAPPEPPPAIRFEPPPAPAPVPEEEVLELTQRVDPPKPAPAKPLAFEDASADLDVFSSPPPAPPRPAPPSFAQEPLVGSYAAETSATHFGALARTVAMPRDSRTLEDVVREMLKPLLRDWLDHNLPAIVEARVQAEVERISRRQDY